MRRIRSICCARAASGQAAPEPTIPLTKSRRRIASPRGLRSAPTVTYRTQLQQGFATGEMGFGVSLHGSNLRSLMSALGQKRTLFAYRGMDFAAAARVSKVPGK